MPFYEDDFLESLNWIEKQLTLLSHVCKNHHTTTPVVVINMKKNEETIQNDSTHKTSNIT